MPYLPDLSRILMNGYSFQTGIQQDGYTECQLQVNQITTLVLTSGKIVACDPFTLLETEPFLVMPPYRHYSVFLAMAVFNGGDRQNAFAGITLQHEKVYVWEMALKAGQDMNTLKEDEFFGYRVDSGIGCFMDAEAVPLLKAKMQNEGFSDTLIEAMKINHQSTGWDYANVTLNPDNGLNVVAFRPGRGNGSYPSFWGLDGQFFEVACLVTDFCIFPYRDDSDNESSDDAE